MSSQSKGKLPDRQPVYKQNTVIGPRGRKYVYAMNFE